MNMVSLAQTIIISLLLTIFVYMIVPVIILLTRKKFSKKVVNSIVIINGAVGFIFFTVLNVLMGVAGPANISATCIWSCLAAVLLNKFSVSAPDPVYPQNKQPQYNNGYTYAQDAYQPTPEAYAYQQQPNPESKLKPSNLNNYGNYSAQQNNTYSNQSAFCTSCGAKRAPGTNFCTSCGAKF